MGLRFSFITMFLCFLTNCSDADKDIKELFKDYIRLNTTQDYYKFHSSGTWTNAKQTCESEGSSLWYPKDYTEAQTVISFFKQAQNFDWLYIGISDIAVEGTFKTIDGIAIADVYNTWNSNQPDNSGNEDCVHINSNFDLNDIGCDSTYPFVCKKTRISVQEYNKYYKINNLDQNTDTKILFKDYLYLSTTNEYYKFHSPSNWMNAQQICESEGSSFWYPKTRVEAHTVLSFFSPTQTFDWIYVGISDLASEGDFKTVDGNPIADVYHTWKEIQPDIANGAEDCVHINANITLNDVTCNASYPFICKKTRSDVREYKNHCLKDKSNLGTQLVKSYHYIEATKASYNFHKISETWSDAKRICESEGARLFYPDNKDEMLEVLSFCKLQEYFSCLYIGISDLVVEGLFETIDGRLLSDVYNDWQPNEPNNLNCTENCLTVNLAGQLNDDNCSIKYPFVCKMIETASEWNVKCNMSNLDYAYNEEEGKCYKLHQTAMSWIDANRVCRDEQSYLAVINSKRERDYLLSLTRSSPYRETEVLPKDKIHLGFHNRLNDGWITINGTSLDDSGYAHWDVNQPDGSIRGDLEKCGSLSHTGRLHDVACESKSIFICEHDIK